MRNTDDVQLTEVYFKIIQIPITLSINFKLKQKQLIEKYTENITEKLNEIAWNWIAHIRPKLHKVAQNFPNLHKVAQNCTEVEVEVEVEAEVEIETTLHKIAQNCTEQKKQPAKEKHKLRLCVFLTLYKNKKIRYNK